MRHLYQKHSFLLKEKKMKMMIKKLKNGIKKLFKEM